jgi:alanine racemase
MTITTGRASFPATPIERRLRDAGLPPLRRLAWIEVDLSILEANARLIRGLLPRSTRLGIVVKAGGYGHGLVASARAAAAGGAELLLVATLDEALALRAAGVDLPVLVLYPVPREAVLEAVRAGIELTAADPVSLRDIAGALRVGAPRPVVRDGARARRWRVARSTARGRTDAGSWKRRRMSTG